MPITATLLKRGTHTDFQHHFFLMLDTPHSRRGKCRSSANFNAAYLDSPCPFSMRVGRKSHLNSPYTTWSLRTVFLRNPQIFVFFCSKLCTFSPQFFVEWKSPLKNNKNKETWGFHTICSGPNFVLAHHKECWRPPPWDAGWTKWGLVLEFLYFPSVIPRLRKYSFHQKHIFTS